MCLKVTPLDHVQGALNLAPDIFKQQLGHTLETLAAVAAAGAVTLSLGVVAVRVHGTHDLCRDLRENFEALLNFKHR